MSSLFARTHPLPAGPRVRLRLAVRADAPAVADLLAGRGVRAGAMDIRRLLSYDPLERAVVAAYAPVDDTERLVGVAAMDLEEGCEPDTLVVDERLTDGLVELLCDVLADKAADRSRRVA